MSCTARGLRLLEELPDNAGKKKRLFRAPGRVNIIGEHTDYTGGFGLPTTTGAYTWAAASVRNDRTVNIRSLNLDNAQSFDLGRIESSAEPKWVDYAKGVAALLQANNINVRGADIVIDSEIPIGGGLSSSAALEVVIATTMLDLASAQMSAISIAQLCQRAEIEYAGVQCGVMDQFAVACCERGNAVLLDCRDLSSRSVRLPDNIRLLVTDSGVKHVLPHGDYNKRTTECAEATELLTKHVVGLSSLRDLSIESLEDNRNTLSDPLYRRCKHVVNENLRALHAYEALQAADAKRLGELISASHRSLREDYEVSCDEVDSLVEIADSCDGVFGSRMIGGGFGGCILSIVDESKSEQVRQVIAREYKTPAGATPWMHVVSPTDPAQKVTYQ